MTSRSPAMISLSAPFMRHRTGRVGGLCLLAVALLWATTARAQVEPHTGDHIAEPVPPGLWTRVTAAIRPPPERACIGDRHCLFHPVPRPAGSSHDVGSRNRRLPAPRSVIRHIPANESSSYVDGYPRRHVANTRNAARPTCSGNAGLPAVDRSDDRLRHDAEGDRLSVDGDLLRST